MQMFFCFAVIINVSVVADAFIASFCTNFPKEFAILGKQLFLPASMCISYNFNAWQSHTKVSLAEKKRVIQSLVVHQFCGASMLNE